MVTSKQILEKELNHQIDHFAYELDLIIGPLYPVMQAFGMLFLKDSSDPLKKVSTLDLITIYTKNQMKLSSFEELLVSGDEYQELDEDKQNLILEALKKTNSVVTTIPTQPSFVDEGPLIT